jgi:acyl carrier protein
MQEIYQKVRELISEKKGLRPDEIFMSNSFEELDMDSLDSMELISE